MKQYPGELSRILDILKENPRGMSVSDIAAEIGLNRNTVSRYLDMLLISGQADMKTYGKAKVFYLSQRLPVSAMLDFSSDLVVVVDKELCVVQVNDRFCDFVDGKREEIAGQPLRDSNLAVLDHPLIMERIRAALDGTESTDDLSIIKAGQESFYRIRIVASVFNDGSPGVTVMLEDVTEQKNAEAALIESEHTYRTLVEEINDAIWELDQTQTFTYVSPRTNDLLGYESDELVGQIFMDFLENGDARKVTDQLKASLESDKEERCLIEIPLRHKDGTEVILEMSACARIDMLGEKVGHRIVCRDATERKKAWRKVSQWKKFLFSIVENIPAMVIVKETETGVIIFMNASAERALGVTSDQVTGKTPTEVFTPGIVDILLEGDEAVLAEKGEVLVGKAVIERPGHETKYVMRRKIPLFYKGENPKYLLSIFSDMTWQKVQKPE